MKNFESATNFNQGHESKTQMPTFEEARTLYFDLISSTISKRDERLKRVADHRTQWTSNLHVSLSAEDINRKLVNEYNGVSGTLADTSNTLSSILDYSVDFTAYIDDTDKGVWETVQRYVENAGIKHQFLGEVLDKASSKQSRDAMVLALDARVWETAQSYVKHGTIMNQFLGDVLQHASCKQTRDAMIQALDARVWETVQSYVDHGTVKNQFIGEVLDRASSREIRDAMVLALDMRVWAYARQYVGGINNPYVGEVLGRASSKSMADLFRKHLGGGDTSKNQAWSSSRDNSRASSGGASNGHKSYQGGSNNGRSQGSSRGQQNTWSDSGYKSSQTSSGYQQSQQGRGDQRGYHSGNNTYTQPPRPSQLPQKPAYEKDVDADILKLRDGGLAVEAIQKKLRRKYHPDVNPSQNSKEAFQYIDFALGLAKVPRSRR